MDNTYLQELIEEAQKRDGGLLLNFNDKPAVVVLTIEKYNEIIQKSEIGNPKSNTIEQEDPTGYFNGKTVLVTGGAGYIGSHLVRELIKAGYEVVILDNLSTGRRENLDARAMFIEGDIKDLNLLRDIFATYEISAVFHLAASLEVEESVAFPEKYFENNVTNTARLLQAMNEAGVKKIIFSSTAAVYGEPDEVPVKESAPLKPNNPYGASKLLAERVIKYYCTYLGFKAVIFRYFNACGCDYDGLIKPTHDTHLLANVLSAARTGQQIKVFGNDYLTRDGTCIRDYVHVLDIAKAHLKAIDKIGQGENFNIYNIGTGRGQSVQEIIQTTSEILNRIIPMEIAPRRPGDAAVTIADNTKLLQELGYQLQHSDLQTIVSTGWNQITKNQL